MRNERYFQEYISKKNPADRAKARIAKNVKKKLSELRNSKDKLGGFQVKNQKNLVSKKF